MEYIKKSLQDAKTLTGQMVEILDNFEYRLSKLEQSIGPIQSETTHLKNINLSTLSFLKTGWMHPAD